METFMIGAWQAPLPTLRNYRIMSSCGINTLFLNGIYTLNAAHVKKAVEIADKTNISIILEGGSDLNSSTLFNNIYKDNKSIVGINVYDEPKIGQLGEIRNKSSLIKRAYSDKWFYVNLLPSYAPNEAISDYQTYIEEYAKLIRETDGDGGWLSIDHYPLRRTEEGRLYLSETWLNDVETVAMTAKKYYLRTHFFIQSMAYGGDISTLNDRQPTLEDFRLQLYVYLCYGARGISHFCYQSPFSGEFGPHQTGLWYNGRKTERWAIARKVNREILSFSSEYLKLSWNGCIKISGNDNDIFKKLYHYDFTKCRFIKDISTDDDILVGVFSDNDGREGYVIVNYSETSQRKCVNLDIVLNKEAKITLYKNSKRKTKRVKEGFALTLKSGEGVFMTLSD